jgi:xylulokinase
MDTFLGIDLGTSSVKVMVLDAQGRTQGLARQEYTVKSPHPGWAEGDPQEWWMAVVTAVQAVMTQVGQVKVAAIGLSGQMHGIVPVDAQGQPVRDAILWADGRAQEELAHYQALPAATRQRLANPLVAGMAGPMLCWLARHEPARYAATRWMLQPKDWLRFCLTGRIVTDPSDASATLLYDLPADDWARDVVDTLGLRQELLPEILPSTSIAGPLTEQAAQVLSLAAGTPVAVGAADTAAAALGTSLLMPEPVQLTLGTGAQIIRLRSQPLADATLRTHLYRAAGEASWYSMAAVQNAGLALDWVRNLLGASWDEMYATIDTVVPGAQGLVFRPYLTQERFLPATAGAFLNLRLHHRREHLLRAALEGVAFTIRYALELLPGGEQMKLIRLAGGGSMHEGWCHLLADALQCKLVAVDTPDASARGAALLAGIAVGHWLNVAATDVVAPRIYPVAVPREATAARYNELYAHFREQVQREG